MHRNCDKRNRLFRPMNMNGTLGSKGVQIILGIIAVTFLIIFLLSSQSSISNIKPRAHNDTHEAIELSTSNYYSGEIIDYRRCSPLEPLRIFVHSFDHPLAIALANHPAVTKDESEACLFIAFTTGGAFGEPSRPSSWHSRSEKGINHVLVNLNDDISIAAQGREIIVQANFDDGKFRPLLDFSLSPDVAAFDSATWQRRPSIMPLKRKIAFSQVVDVFDISNSDRIPQIECRGECFSSLINSSFCLLSPSPSFHYRLLESLRAGCIPVVLSTTQPLPFQDLLDWRLASIRFPRSMASAVPEMLEELDKEDLMEMRRRGRVFLARIDDAQTLAKSLVAALSERIHIDLPLHPKVPSNLVAPDGVFKNVTYKFERIQSKFGTKKLSASRLYSRARWNSGRDLTYTPQTLHDVPQLPGDAPFYEDTKEHFLPMNGAKRLGLTRDEEQFTVIILTYDRDEELKNTIEKLHNCPYLNKIIIVWNNLERRPNGTWPEIHVPIEFVLSDRNTLNNRFIPYDRIETEAVVSLDDDIGFGQPELTFAFRMWRENRDRVVGFPERYHKFKNGKGAYGLSGTCEYSLILTGFAMMHKEFLFEFTYNQHPAILEYIEKNRNCEDLAMNYLVSHLTRKPPLRVVKKVNIISGAAKSGGGLSSRGNHYKERDGCISMLSALYGYNPLLFTQEVARPNGNCVEGL